MFIQCLSLQGEPVIVNAERIIDIYPGNNGVNFLYDRSPSTTTDRPGCGKCFLPNISLEGVANQLLRQGLLLKM